MGIPRVKYFDDLGKQVNGLRWFLTTVFTYLALTKGLIMLSQGLLPYAAIARVAEFPLWFKYAGLVALVIEVYFVFGVWWRRVFKTAVLGGIVLTIIGSGLSLYSLWFKLSSDCGCGLLGTNELGLLFQKLGLCVALIFLYRKQSRLVF